MPESPARVNISSFLRKLPLQMSFPSSGIRHSVLVPIFLCTVLGILTAIMGVGGGFLIVPLMAGLLQVPVRVAVGTSLFQILFTSVDTTFLQAVENHTVDIEMALMLGLGSAIGAQIGARVSRFLRGEQLMILLAILALSITLKMTLGIFLPPANLLDPAPVLATRGERAARDDNSPRKEPANWNVRGSPPLAPAVVRRHGVMVAHPGGKASIPP